MATMKWNIWIKKGIYHREDRYLTVWQDELKDRLTEYPLLDEKYERSIVRKY